MRTKNYVYIIVILLLVNVLYSCNKDNYNNNYSNCISLIENAKCVKEYSTAINIDNYDTICLGKYELDGIIDNDKEDIEWIILDKNENNVLLLSKYILDFIVYDQNQDDVTWEKCSLRKWLNSEFINQSFNYIEKTRIIPTELLNNDNNTIYGSTIGGNDTIDYVFCLSIDEVNKYFGNNLIIDEKKIIVNENSIDFSFYSNNYTNASTTGTDYYIQYMKYDGAGGDWWLRSPGAYQDYCSYVNKSGWIDTRGTNVDNPFMGIRPALWLKYK